jgi:hypothetical protein
MNLLLPSLAKMSPLHKPCPEAQRLGDTLLCSHARAKYGFPRPAAPFHQDG